MRFSIEGNSAISFCSISLYFVVVRLVLRQLTASLSKSVYTSCNVLYILSKSFRTIELACSIWVLRVFSRCKWLVCCSIVYSICSFGIDVKFIILYNMGVKALFKGTHTMAEAYLETTEWEDGSKGINHTYYLEGDKMLAYIRMGTSQPFWFAKPITISRSGRKFQRVDAGPFERDFNIIIDEPTVDPDVVEVQGSKGAVYYVNKVEGTCTCPGYTYRGTCKHVKEL